MKRAVLLLLLFALALEPASAAIDPFYGNRMENGFRAFDRGDWEEAEHQLRIACFGHLDEPVALVEGLIRLAIVEVQLGDEAAFQRTFSRLVELEERFSAYSSAQLPQSVRQQFESQAARLAPLRSLEATAGFEAIAERADIQRLAVMPPDQRRAALEEKIRTEPQRTDWPLEMVRLELAARRPQAALGWLDRLPAEAAGRVPATCLRQQAASEIGDCAQVDLGQPFCQDVPATVVEFRLQCLVDAGRWPEAAAVLAGLDPELRQSRRVSRLRRRVANNIGSAGEAPAQTASSGAQRTAVAVPAPTPPADTEPVPTNAALDPLEIQRLRDRLAAAQTGDELAFLMSDAKRLADNHPESRQPRLLAAEIAYLQSDWPTAVSHFQQVGSLRLDEAHLAFYQAVALYESGEPAAAAEVLRPVVSRLERTSFVEAYVDRILAPGV